VNFGGAYYGESMDISTWPSSDCVDHHDNSTSASI